ncbi:MAG: STAS/SEC14 domain-containing protein [bacterium]|nr:STAS/SEC14 domain-containing protein [bacterium]
MQVEAQLSTSQLLKATEQMSEDELDRFVAEVLALRASHRAPRLSKTESELLVRINQGIPQDLQQRYDELIARRREGMLTEAEHGELLRLTEQVEELDVTRVELLAELARLRKSTLPAVMADLGIEPPPYV